ncbi:helix-turn-helix domain-containing protein [Candidatus Solirubrobacter pratensis]|uniref:helix-turn-helix domain-containing protein n=1 Tax=Candidatus Solirubrobacter pratensis TaxID=1298857 RepID=UPI00040C11D3|nr:helix-turn-helix domain-containing protein [Candidatus Solirubrobacter pratensis]
MRQRDRNRANAHRLRVDGHSIRQIAKQLQVPRSTIAAWIRDEGEWHEYRNCQLCGSAFRVNGGNHRFCTRQHAEKYARMYLAGRKPKQERYRERIRELEAEVYVLRAALEIRDAA